MQKKTTLNTTACSRLLQQRNLTPNIRKQQLCKSALIEDRARSTSGRQYLIIHFQMNLSSSIITLFHYRDSIILLIVQYSVIANSVIF